MNWMVSISYRPKRRVVYGKRTKVHTYYRVLADRDEAFALTRQLNQEIRDHEAKWRKGWIGHFESGPYYVVRPSAYSTTPDDKWVDSVAEENKRKAKAKRAREKARKANALR